MGLVSRLDARFYPGVENYWDDRAFRAFVLERLSHDAVLLDLGAGAGILPEMNFRGHAARICGVDPDPRVAGNLYLDEGKVGQGESIPYPDATFDIVISDNVLEHLTQPEIVFAEVLRVLKPGGRFLFKTPNWTHYMPIIAWATPHGFHRWFNRLRGRAVVDTFPTVYRANTPATVKARGGNVGFEAGTFELLESRPEYLRITVPSYLAGIAYERLVNRFSVLARFRILMIGELVKPARHAQMSANR
jgi:SAM-dependent methyltransferase